MVQRAFRLLGKNPAIIIFYIIYALISVSLMVFLIPKSSASPDPLEAVLMLGKIFLVLGLFGILLVFFLSGFGNMLAKAVTSDMAAVGDFPEGLKKFFVNVLLASLLLLAFYIGFSIVIGIISLPITMVTMFKSGLLNNPQAADPNAIAASPQGITVIISVISGLAAILLLPLVALWYPAIFIDNAGPIESLKRGAKAGVKNYWKLVLAMLVTYLPYLSYTVAFHPTNTAAMLASPIYWAVSALGLAISLVVVLIIFIMYADTRITQQSQQL